MNRILLVSPNALSTEAILRELPSHWWNEFDEIGFLGARSEELHDLLDDFLIEMDLENTITTLIFDNAADQYEYMKEVESSGGKLIILELPEGPLPSCQT